MTRESQTIAVIGGGPAGLEASAKLTGLGYNVFILEKNTEVGGHLLDWDRLFPDQQNASEVLDAIKAGLNENTQILTGAEVVEISENHRFDIKLAGSPQKITADAILVATGFDVFDARKKEEYGYGIYDHVITSAELETYFKNKKEILKRNGSPVKRIAFIHCVGSRDEKAGVRHCSRVCCVTAVKQAIEVKELYPDVEVYLFYMDLRMFGLGYEELYKEAQEIYNIRFIRGRLSESFENQDGTIMVKVEDTLAGKPMRINVDLMVLMVGILASSGTSEMGSKMGIGINSNGFLKPVNSHFSSQISNRAGVFLAGTCKSPKNIEETLSDARAAAVLIDNYLKAKIT